MMGGTAAGAGMGKARMGGTVRGVPLHECAESDQL